MIATHRQSHKGQVTHLSPRLGPNGHGAPEDWCPSGWRPKGWWVGAPVAGLPKAGAPKAGAPKTSAPVAGAPKALKTTTEKNTHGGLASPGANGRQVWGFASQQSSSRTAPLKDVTRAQS